MDSGCYERVRCTCSCRTRNCKRILLWRSVCNHLSPSSWAAYEVLNSGEKMDGCLYYSEVFSWYVNSTLFLICLFSTFKTSWQDIFKQNQTCIYCWKLLKIIRFDHVSQFHLNLIQTCSLNLWDRKRSQYNCMSKLGHSSSICWKMGD